MRTTVGVLIGLLWVSAGAGLEAATLQQRDWLAPGDGLLTYAPAAGLEYLDLSETLVSQFTGPLLENRYQAVVSQLAPGDRYDGFRVATAAEAQLLLDEAGVDTDAIDFATNGEPIETLIDLLGATDVSGSEARFVAIVSDTIVNRRLRQTVGVLLTPDDPVVQALAGVFEGYDVTFSEFPTPDIDDYGVLLVRSAVPEPNALYIVCACLSACWRRHSA